MRNIQLMISFLIISLQLTAICNKPAQKPTIAIYLAGSIQKSGESASGLNWGESEMEQLQTSLSEYQILFLNPAIRSDDLSDPTCIFGRDMSYISSSDFVFVDARERRGLGVGAEMMWAKVNQIPVISWAPANSHYNNAITSVLGLPAKDFIHPFVEALSDEVVETLIQGAEWIRKITLDPTIPIKNTDQIQVEIDHYKSLNGNL